MSRKLPRTVVSAVDAAKILGIRAGAKSDHKFVGVWPIIVDGRVFARSWTVKRGGWYQAFLEDPLGAIQAGDREVRIRAIRASGLRLLDKIDEAYAEKYSTKASMKYVRGFRTARRRDTTTEFVPR